MNNGIDYAYKGDPPLEGWECPTCHQKSWWVLQCNNCKKIFCKHCKPEFFKCNAWYKQNAIFKNEDFDPAFADDDDGINVTCECGSTTYFCN